MKILPVIACLIFSSSLFGRDFLPDSHFETLPAEDSSVQECYVFRTTAGVCYTVQFSNDLTHWTDQDEVYGLGHEYVVSMRQFTPPPPPPPGAPVLVRPAPPVNASIRMQRISGTTGGTQVSWASLDHGGPIVVRIAGEMAADWFRFPLLSERVGGYSFFFWHPYHVAAPPTEVSTLGVKDSAMLAVLEAELPAMNLRVIASLAAARNTPPPAPPDPDSRRFWRILVDPSTDTDADGIADWSEFEMAANAAAGQPVHFVGNFLNKPAPGGNAFNFDSNGDGIADGEQLDTDGDGVADAFDIASSDPTAAFRIEPLPRYALFPITPGQDLQSSFPDALQINDKGRVLYQNGTWSAGTWTPLAAPQSGTIARAFAINDHDTILGSSVYRISQDPPHDVEVVHYWTNPQAVPEKAQSNGDITKAYAAGTAGNNYGVGYLPRPMLSNDGRFNSITREWSTTPGQVRQQDDDSEGTTWYENTLRTSTWKLPAAGFTTCTETPGSDTMPFYGDPALNWGYAVARDANGNETGPRTGQVLTPDVLPGLGFTPYHVFTAPGGILALPSTYGAPVPKFFREGTWQDAPLFTNALDMATDGTAIADGSGATNLKLFAPILLNGKWTDIKRYAPGAPSEWADLNTVLLDTTPGGWILARRNDGTSGGAAGVMLPLRVEGVNTRTEINPDGSYFTDKKAVGVDDFSVGATDPGPAVRDRIWIMAPIGGGTNKVTIKSPLDANTPLKITAVGITFPGETEGVIQGPNSILEVAARSTTPSGADVTAILKMGTGSEIVISKSLPIGIKPMKSRVVKVNVFEICRRQTPGGTYAYASLMPTEPNLTAHLNDLFRPQINVTFDVKIYNEVIPLAWDANGNQTLDTSLPGTYTTEQETILAALPENRRPADITVLVMASRKDNNTVMPLDGDSAGITNRIGTTGAPGATCWILGEISGKQNGHYAQLDTICHEIGHVFTDYGHPDLRAFPGPAPLRGTERQVSLRLMCSGGKSTGDSRLLVKGEWDRADAWLKRVVDGEGNQ